MKENSREDRINNAYCFLNSMHSDFRTGVYYKEDLENLDHILSDYKRVLKINEVLLKENEMYKRNSEIMSKENLSTAEQLKVEIKENFRLKNQLENNRKEYQETYKDVREKLKELKKENKELKISNKKLYEIGQEMCKQDKYTSENYILVQKVKDKIEELPLIIVGGRKNKKTLEYGIKLGRRQALQELIEEREEK